MKASPLSTALLVATAIACTGCSPLAVEWTMADDELALVAHGPPRAMLVVIAGLPSEPHTMPGDPSLWTTVGPDRTGQAPNVEVARVPFDATGIAKASVKVGALPAEVILVQAIALSADVPAKAVAVSACMAVARRSGKLRIRPHIIEVLDSSVWLRFGALAAIVALALLLKKTRIPFFRAAGLGLLFLAAAALLADRWRAPRNQALPLDAPPPFVPNRIDDERRKMDPLDRVTRPGFRELVSGARGATSDGDAIVIVPPSLEWEALRDAWQAQWMLWPRHAEILPPDTDPYAQRGVYLTFDVGPRKAGARVLFKNRIGCLWAVDAGEPQVMGLEPAIAIFLLLVALPAGLLLTRGLLPARSRVARGGTATLAALGVFAALTHAGMAVGARGRIVIPALAAAGLAAGIWGIARSRRRGGTPVPQGGPRPLARAVLLEAGPLAAVVALLAFSYVDASRFGIAENDAIRIWAPKAARALDEAPPRLEGTDQAHPEYPRGVGILTATVATCVGHLDARLPRLVPLFLFAMALLAIFDALSARGNVAGAFAALLILGAIPVVLRQASSGLMDLPLAGFFMLGGIGIAPQRDGRPAIAIALAGAWGAMVTKDEGLVACGALLLVLLVRLVKSRQLVAALTALTLTAMVAAPWILLRSHVHGEPFLLRSSGPNAGLLLMRFDTMIVEIGHLAFGLPDPSPGGFSLPDVVPGRDLLVLAAIACGLVLLTGRGGSFPVLPAGLLLITDFWVIVFSTVGIDWQLVTAYNRLVLQVFPLLLLAAIDKLTTARPVVPTIAPAPAEAPAAAAA